MFNPVTPQGPGYAEHCCPRPLHGASAGTAALQGRSQLPQHARCRGWTRAFSGRLGVSLSHPSPFLSLPAPQDSISRCAIRPASPAVTMAMGWCPAPSIRVVLMVSLCSR